MSLLRSARGNIQATKIRDAVRLIGLIVADWKKPHTAHMRPIVIFDLVIVSIYAAYLFHSL
jgi:hypothetical protein